MYAFCLKQRSLLRNGFAVNLRNSSIFELGYVQTIRILPIKLFSSQKKSKSLAEDDKHQRNHSFEVSYLMDSCGLTPEAALSASKMVHFESSKGPDSILALLRNYGFQNAHISRMIRRCPKLISAKPEETLVPKLEFFRSKGLSGSELPKVLCSCPEVLFRSLENRLVPIYDFLKSILGHDTKVTAVLRRGWWIMGADMQRNIVPNVALLKEFGVPQSILAYLVTTYPTMLGRKREELGAKVKEVMKMGFNPSKTGFAHALAATIQMTKSTWQKKVKVFKKWGWSDAEISLAFGKNPLCLRLSEMKIENVMHFLVNKMGVQSTVIASNTVVLSYSLEKRIIPRCLVVRFLLLKGVLKKELSLQTYLNPSEEQFLDNYVTRYQDQFPEILGVYQGKANLIELGLETGDISTKAWF